MPIIDAATGLITMGRRLSAVAAVLMQAFYEHVAYHRLIYPSMTQPLRSIA